MRGPVELLKQGDPPPPPLRIQQTVFPEENWLVWRTHSGRPLDPQSKLEGPHAKSCPSTDFSREVKCPMTDCHS